FHIRQISRVVPVVGVVLHPARRTSSISMPDASKLGFPMLRIFSFLLRLACIFGLLPQPSQSERRQGGTDEIREEFHQKADHRSDLRRRRYSVARPLMKRNHGITSGGTIGVTRDASV